MCMVRVMGRSDTEAHASASLLRHISRCREQHETEIKDVVSQNVEGNVVLYVLNAGRNGSPLIVKFRDEEAYTVIPDGSITTLVWKP